MDWQKPRKSRRKRGARWVAEKAGCSRRKNG